MELIEAISMIKKVIYYGRIVCFILYLLMMFFMLPYIYQSGWPGILFLVMLVLFVSSTLWSLLSNRAIFKEMVSYNLIIIALTLYFAVITARLLLDPRLQISTLYTVNIEYCQTNFIILSFVMLGIGLNTIILYLNSEFFEQKKKKRQ